MYKRIDTYLGCLIGYWIPMEPKTNLIGPFVHNHKLLNDQVHEFCSKISPRPLDRNKNKPNSI